MTAPFDLKARLVGLQIWDWSDPVTRERACKIAPLLCDVELRYDEVYISYHSQSILAGELSHYLWRRLQVELNRECRDQAREHIRATAERILGEPWKLSDESGSIQGEANHPGGTA